MDGSVDNVCAVDDGKCTCKENIAGHNCDKSAPGWWNFPTPQGIRSIFKKFEYSI